jgi:hypothetical protein
VIHQRGHVPLGGSQRDAQVTGGELVSSFIRIKILKGASAGRLADTLTKRLLLNCVGLIGYLLPIRLAVRCPSVAISQDVLHAMANGETNYPIEDN